MIYKHEHYTLEIKFVLNTDSPVSEAWNFVYEDLKSGKEYEQQYTLTELMDKHKILTVYPTMFSRLAKDKEPIIKLENGVHVCWEIDILGEKDIIELNIKKKSLEGVSDEVIELR